MTSTLLNRGNGHVDSGCAHLRASCAVASRALVRRLQAMGRDVALLVRHPSARGGSAGARSG
jgi:hypothetical protein